MIKYLNFERISNKTAWWVLGDIEMVDLENLMWKKFLCFLMGIEYFYKFWASKSHIDFRQDPRMNYYRSTTFNISSSIASGQSYTWFPIRESRKNKNKQKTDLSVNLDK